MTCHADEMDLACGLLQCYFDMMFQCHRVVSDFDGLVIEHPLEICDGNDGMACSCFVNLLT